MKPNQFGINDDIKTYIKIRQFNNDSLDNPYLEISPENTIVTLSKGTSNQSSKDIRLRYEVDQVFKDKDEYSYIYENITLSSIANAFNGINTCFFSYGETNSEKHSLIFGSSNSYDNIAERGIFPRFVESLLSKDSISISYSLMCVNGNRLMDLTNFLFKNLNSFTEEDFITQSLEIKQPQIVNNVNKIPLKSNKELNMLIKEFNSLYAYLYAIEQSSAKAKLNTSSHFLYIIYLYDKKNNNQLLSNISLCELSGQDMLITKITNPNNSNPKSILNTKLIIGNTYTFECIKKSIKTLKLSDKYSKASPMDNAKLLIVLEKLSFNSPSTKFIILGSILYNVGMHNLAKEVLQFLFDCKRICEERRALDEAQASNMEKTKDDLIFNLQARCRELDKENKKLSEMISNKNELLLTRGELYKKQMDKLKSLFCFEGDVNVLLGGSENSKEMKFVKNIRDTVNKIGVTKQQNQELINKITQLKSEADLLKNTKDVIINDQTLLKYANTTKEKNQNELSKIKLTFDNSQRMIELKEANEKLTQVNESYQKELQSKNQILQNLPKAFEINKEHSKIRQELKDDLRLKKEEKNKMKVRGYQINYEKEAAQIEKKYEGLAKDKDLQIKNIKESYDQLLTKNRKDKDIHGKEMIILYEMITNLISSFKSEFNWKVSPQISLMHYNKFLTAKDNFLKVLERTEVNLNMTNLPETMNLIESKRFNGKFKELQIEAFTKLQLHSKDNQRNDDLVLELARNNKELQRRLTEMIECANSKEDKCSCGNKEHLIDSKEKIANKLEIMINDNTRKGMVISVNERVINKLKSENMTMKEMLRQKLITEKVNYPLPLALNSASFKSDPLHKSKSTKDIVMSFSYIKPNKKYDSVRLFSG